MAGSYPNVPSRRMAFDDDGSVGFACTGDGPGGDAFGYELTAGQMALINNQDTDTIGGPVGNTDWGIFIMFPELREIDGALVAPRVSTGNGSTVLMYSVAASTATNPFTGWSQSVASGSTPDWDITTDRDGYRDLIVSMAEPSRRGFAGFRPGADATAFVHIYGEISPGETPDKIIIIDENTGVEFTAAYDYGDIPRGGSEDIEIRLRNDSATLTANTVQYTVESLGVDGGGGYGGGHGWFTATLPGGAVYQATNQIASIGPATTSGLIKLRRITPADEEPRVFAPRLQVTHASFT
jgi:hypothetical protein